MKTKKTFLNIITDVIPLIIVSLLGIYKIKLFIQVLGNETLGLYQLFNNLMIYIAIVDGGLSSALLFSLYKPNTSGDEKKVNALLSAGLKTFSKIGMYVFGMATILSFLIIFLIKDSPFSYWYIVLTFLIFSISSVIEYYFVPYNTLLEVKEKKYILNLLTQIGQILISVVEIIMLLSGIGFVYILLSHSIIKLIVRVIEVLLCKKKFPNADFHFKEKDYSFKKMLGPLVFHKINGLVGSNIDSLIISSMLGLESVAIYSAYNYIINMLKNILGKISSSMTALIGNSLETSKEKMYDLYLEFDTLLFFMAIIICTPLMLSIDGFINMFYEGNIQTSFLIAISFSLILFTFIIKMDTNLFVNAAGLYKETKHCAIVDTIVNLVLSLVLVYIIGIPGVIIATTVSVLIAEYILKTIVVHKNVFKTSSMFYFLKNIKFFVIFVIDLVLGYYIVNLFSINSLLMWFIFYIIFTFVNMLVIFIIFSLFNETNFIQRFKMLIKKDDMIDEKM